MIPMLFRRESSSFTGAGLGWLPECTFCEVTEERNGIFECEFRYPVNGPMFKQIRPGCIVRVPYDVSGAKQPFDIYAFSVDITGMATFRARHVSYRLNKLLWSCDYNIRGRIMNGRDGVLENLNGISYRNMNRDPYLADPRFIGSGFSDTSSENPYISIEKNKMMSMREIILGGDKSVTGQSNTEVKWDETECTVYKRRGIDSTAVIRVGHNLSALTYEYDMSDVCDVYIPYWTDRDTGALYTMIYLPSDATSYPDGAIGAPCVYDHIYEKNGLFTAAPLDVTTAFEKTVTDANPNGLPTADDVYNYACDEYDAKHIGQAYENLTIDFRPLWELPEYSQNIAPAEKLKLCDTAQVCIPELGINKRMKVCKTVWNVLEERYTRLEFGNSQRTIYTVNYDNGTAEESDEGTVIIVDEDIPEGDPIGE